MLTSSDQVLSKLRTLFTFNKARCYPNVEVQSTEPSLSVSIPWLQVLLVDPDWEGFLGRDAEVDEFR